MEVLSLTAETEEEVSKELREAVAAVEKHGSEGDNKACALVIEGTSLAHSLTKENEKLLLKLAGRNLYVCTILHP